MFSRYVWQEKLTAGSFKSHEAGPLAAIDRCLELGGWAGRRGSHARDPVSGYSSEHQASEKVGVVPSRCPFFVPTSPDSHAF